MRARTRAVTKAERVSVDRLITQLRDGNKRKQRRAKLRRRKANNPDTVTTTQPLPGQ